MSLCFMHFVCQHASLDIYRSLMPCAAQLRMPGGYATPLPGFCQILPWIGLPVHPVPGRIPSFAVCRAIARIRRRVRCHRFYLLQLQRSRQQTPL